MAGSLNASNIIIFSKIFNDLVQFFYLVVYTYQDYNNVRAQITAPASSETFLQKSFEKCPPGFGHSWHKHADWSDWVLLHC